MKKSHHQGYQNPVAATLRGNSPISQPDIRSSLASFGVATFEGELAQPQQTTAIDWQVAVDEFLADCRRRNLKPKTIAFYTGCLFRCTEWLTARKITVESVRRKDIQTWQDIRQTEIGPTTMRSELISLRTLCKFLMNEGYMRTSPVINYVLPKASPPTKTPPTDDTVLRLLDYIPVAAADKSNPRNRITHRTRLFVGRRDVAIYSALIYHGMRVGELMALTFDDIEVERIKPIPDVYDQKQVHVIHIRRTKTDKPRTIPLSPYWQPYFDQYLKVRPKTECQNIFLSTTMEKMREDSISQRWMKYCIESGIGDKYNLHMLRHAFAKRTKRKYLIETAAITGHSLGQSPLAFERYAHVDMADMLCALIAAGPLKGVDDQTDAIAPAKPRSGRRRGL